MKRLVILGVVFLAVILLSFVGCGVNTYTETETEVSTNVNQEFIISLHNPSPRVGSRWYESHDDKILALIEETYAPDDEAHPDFGGNAEFRFKALKVGKTEAIFLYKTVTGTLNQEKVFNITIE